MAEKKGGSGSGWVASIAVGLLIAFVGVPFGARCGSHDEFALEKIRECPRAVELLGDDVGLRPVGWACGSVETRGGLERASWSLPVAGSRGSGRIRYAYSRVGGGVRWSGHVEVDGEEISVPCK